MMEPLPEGTCYANLDNSVADGSKDERPPSPPSANLSDARIISSQVSNHFQDSPIGLINEL